MKYHVPNILTLSRLPVAVAVLVTGSREQWQMAAVLLLVGLATDALDGHFARRFNATSRVGEVWLEPICDAALALSALLALVLSGLWPWWSLMVVLAVAALLQAISWLDDVSRGNPGYDQSIIKRLKRHQYWVHPLFAVILLIVISAVFVFQAFGGWVAFAAYAATLVALGVAKRGRIKRLTRGPMAAS